VRAPDAVADAELLKPWQLQRQQFKNKKHAIGDRQKTTLERLAAFKSKLGAAGTTTAAASDDNPDDNHHHHQQQQSKEAGSAAAAAAAAGGHGSKVGAVQDEAAYDGKVKGDIDHRAYMPAAWRVDDYGEGEEEEEGPLDLAALRKHRLEFARGSKAGELQLGGDGRCGFLGGGWVYCGGRGGAGGV